MPTGIQHGTWVVPCSTVRAEKSALDFVAVDFNLDISSEDFVANILLDILTRQYAGDVGETEYCIDRDSVYIGRLTTATAVNEMFVPGTHEPEPKLLKEGAALKGALQSGKICFQNDSEVSEDLPGGYVEIEVKAIVINEQDSSVISGSDESAEFNQEISGITNKVGVDVSNLLVGGRVVAFSLYSISIHQRTKSQFVQRITNESFIPASTWLQHLYFRFI